MEKKLDKDLLKKIQQIDIRLRRKVNSLLSGQYRSAFKGQGMVFSDFREYIPGDDIRAISWNLTAKMSRPFVKTFEEDRETQLILVVDASASLNFGTGDQSKFEVISLLTALVAFCAEKNKDPVGLLIFAEDIEIYVPPKKGTQHVFRLIREICNIQTKTQHTNIISSLHFLQKVLKKRSHIFLFSDFLWPEPYANELRMLGNRHDVISVILSDPLEKTLPNLGLVDLEDLETGEIVTVDLSDPWVRGKYTKDLAAAWKKREKELLLAKTEQISINTHKDIYEPFIQFFQKRSQNHAGINRTGQ